MAWLTNWNRRKKININGTTAGAQTVYQMKVTVYYGSGTDSAGKIYCGGKVKGDFSDVRFTDSGGSTLLNYWIESFIIGSNAIVWVKIPSIPASPNYTSIYIYYNNPIETTTSNGLTTFDFFDDFLGTSLDTTKWNIVTRFGYAGNSLSVSNSNITITADSSDGYGICAKTSFSGNQALEARGFYILNKPRSGYMLAPVTLLQDNIHHIYCCATGNGYYAHWVESGSNNANLNKWPAGTYLTRATLAMNANTLYNQSLLLGNTVTIWQVNGTNACPQSNTADYRTGLYAGIQPYAGCKVQVDNAFIRKYANPEPIFGTIASEELSTVLTGSLSITSNPSISRVYIDNIDQAVYTPIIITGLTPGTHNIKLTRDTYYDYYTSVEILANQTTTLNATLTFRGGIVNSTFDVDLHGWTLSGNNITVWESGRARIRSNYQYGASGEQFAYFYQIFTLDYPVLKFDVQALIVGDGDYACGDCLSSPGRYFPIEETCGWTLKDSQNNVIKHVYAGTTLQTVSLDLSNYVGQNLKISFQAGAARYYGEYYDLLVDNVMTVPGILFNPICSDTGQHCDAVLYMDGAYQGTTPYHIAPSVGSHIFTLYKAGYAIYSETINVTSSMIIDGSTIEPVLNPGGGLINGIFDTDLSGWVVSGDTTWDNGRVHIRSGGSISQIFAITDNIVQFDWETHAYWPDDSGLRCQIYIDDVLKIEQRTPGNYWSNISGSTGVYLGNYIGRVAKIVFYELSGYGWEGWVDNVRISHTQGIYNGDFSNGFVGWDTTGEVSIINCGDWPADWNYPPCSGKHAQIGINDGGEISQTFILDKCNLKFDWMSGYSQRYEIYSGNTIIYSRSLTPYSEGTEIVDLSNYVDSTLKILFHSDQFLAIDNVATITNPYDVSVISYPSGAEIYVDDIDTGQTTGDIPVTVDGGSEGTHTVTLKLVGYPDYIETINITRCITTYVSATFGGCITFITNPPGAKICIDNTDTLEVTPKTFCGYGIGTSHLYSLYFKNYRVETETITFPSDKGFLINKTLTYETGSVRFNVIPNGSKIITDGVDTGKLTPDVVYNLPIGYHTYEIRKDNYYSLTGSFRIIVDTEKLIAESLQQVTGVDNGTFDTNLDGWTVTSSNPAQGYVEWSNGRAHLITNDIPITFSKDFVATEDSLVFNYYPPISLNSSCNIGWSVIVDPGTPQQATISSYCGYGQTGYSRYEHWGYFEVDLRQYIGRNIRLNLNLTGHKIFYIGGPAEAYLDNVGNIKPRRSITFGTYCSTIPECPTSSLSLTKCFADIYVDDEYKGIDEITLDNLSIATHSYKVRNQGYTSIDTNNQDITGNITFSQGVPSHVYIDNIYLPTGIVPAEGCIRFESLPPGLHIFIDGQDTGKVTPDTVCNLTHSLSNTLNQYDHRLIRLTTHSYELKLLQSSYQGTFDLGPGFGEYIYVELYGKIQIDTIPEGARVTLDGVDTGGTTPYNTGNIPIGIHTYNIKLDNFQEETCQIEVIKDQTATVNLELVSAEGCVYIDSCPRGSNGWNSTDITLDDTSKGITPLSICGLTGIHNYSLNRVGYDSYSETINFPFGRGINRRIYLNRKIGVPSLDPTKEICSLNSSRVVIQSYVTGGIYLGKDAFEMKDGGIEIIDAQGYDVIHLYILYENFWMGTVDGGVWGEVYIYQSDTSGDCSTRWWQTPSAKPADAELIHYRQDGGWWPPGAGVLLDGSLNISKRYIRIETRVYMCSFWSCWGDGNSSIFVMEQIPIECPMAPTTKCGKIVTCKIKTDEGIYSKDRYCYLGEGIFTKRAVAPPIPPIGTNAISQNCGDWSGAQVDCWIGNDGYLVLENTQFSPGWRYTNFEAKGNYIDFYTPGGLWQLYDATTSTWIVGTGDGYNYGAYISVSGNVRYEIPIANKGHTLQIWFLFPSLHYRYDHIKNMWYT